MEYSRFDIVSAVDINNGIGKDGDIPWTEPEDMKFFHDITVGQGNNAVIMGRKTYQSLPTQVRPLPERHNIVISSTMKSVPNITVVRSFEEALLKAVGFTRVFVIGGQGVYEEAINKYLYLCDQIHLTRFYQDYNCDVFFPFKSISHLPASCQTIHDYDRFIFAPEKHQEYQYLDLCQKILVEGEEKRDRTGTGTLSLFGTSLEFDISEELPLLTTKKLVYDKVIKELLFFISGQTDTKILEEQGVGIWKWNTTSKFLQDRGLDYVEGDMGPAYGFQWRHWGAKYNGCHEDYTGQGIDQLADLIDNLKNNPFSRRHILTAWNVSQLEEMALPPCHFTVQFNVSADGTFIDCQLYQRSADMFLGVPWNIASYAILTYLLGSITGLKPRKLRLVFGDTHIYQNHVEQVKKQLSRTPKPWPTLKLTPKDIDSFTPEDIQVVGYTSWPFISGKMAI